VDFRLEMIVCLEHMEWAFGVAFGSKAYEGATEELRALLRGNSLARIPNLVVWYYING